MESPIGVFDSGYGGLTILREIRKFLPQYDYLYLGDNARAPYGTRSFDIVYRFTLQAVEELFSRGCRLEVAKLFPGMKITGHSCPMWVPLVENNEADKPGADYFVDKDSNALMEADSEIDTVILGCTHYPLLYPKIRKALPSHVTMISQGEIVAASLADYLRRHPEMERTLSRTSAIEYLTTERADSFSRMASIFLHTPVCATQITLS